MSEHNASESAASVANLLNPVDFLSQHDARLDVLVSKITSALHSPDSTPDKLASLAYEYSSSAATSVSSSRDLLSRAFHKAALISLRGGHVHNAEARLRAFDTSLILVDSTISLLQEKRIEARLPITLLEVTFSFHTQTELANRISTIRRRFEAIRAAHPEKVAELYIIKSIMSCINRDQSGSNPVLSGYLRLILAASLPVWHPSGMNRRGQYNTSNIPDYENVLKNEDAPDIDVALYKAFWGAQALVANPSMAESPPQWREAFFSIERVLSAFKAVPPSKELDAFTPLSKDKTEKMRSRIPKYLTSPSILRLQLGDIRVRRHVLMQYAIFLHHLETVAGFIPSGKDTPTSKIGIEFCKKLFSIGGEGIKLRKQVYDVMNADCDGKYKRFVTSLLQRERRWLHWKKHTTYAHLSAKKVSAPTIFKRRKVRSKISEDGMMEREPVSDWEARQKAWFVPSPSSRAAPLIERAKTELWSAEVLKMELKEDMEDEEVSEDMKRRNDSKYVWRTLRMLCEEDVACLVNVASQSNGFLDLEALVREGTDAK